MLKQCPDCKATYADESLRFCSSDGAILIQMQTEGAETVPLAAYKNQMRINVASPDSPPPTVLNAPPQNFQPPVTQSPPSKTFNPVIIGVLGAALLLVVGAGALAVYILSGSTGDGKVAATNSSANSAAINSGAANSGAASSSAVDSSATNSLSPTGAMSDETARLKEEMANLQKQLLDQKNQKQTTAPNIGSAPNQQTYPTIPNDIREARANSPRDGFLALRNEPNSETGYRLAQIPHGATITVLGCPRPSNVGKIAGRWCQVVYNGQSGWAFDAFIRF